MKKMFPQMQHKVTTTIQKSGKIDNTTMMNWGMKRLSRHLVVVSQLITRAAETKTTNTLYLLGVILQTMGLLIQSAAGASYEPNFPLLCNSKVNAKNTPVLWKYPEEQKCLTPKDDQMQPQELNLTVYKHNITLLRIIVSAVPTTINR